MTKAPTPTEKSKTQYDNTNTQPKTSITQWLRTHLGQSVWVMIATQLVWFNRFTGSQPSHLPQKMCNQMAKTNHLYLISAYTSATTCTGPACSAPNQHANVHSAATHTSSQTTVISRPHVITSTGCSGSECTVPNQHGNIHSTATHVSSNVHQQIQISPPLPQGHTTSHGQYLKAILRLFIYKALND